MSGQRLSAKVCSCRTYRQHQGLCRNRCLSRCRPVDEMTSSYRHRTASHRHRSPRPLLVHHLQAVKIQPSQGHHFQAV